MTLRNQIKIDYADYCEMFKMLPNYVDVDVCFDDGTEANSQIISLHPSTEEEQNGEGDDNEIFFYCNGIKELCELCDATNGSEFIIVSYRGLFDRI